MSEKISASSFVWAESMMKDKQIAELEAKVDGLQALVETEAERYKRLESRTSLLQETAAEVGKWRTKAEMLGEERDCLDEENGDACDLLFGPGYEGEDSIADGISEREIERDALRAALEAAVLLTKKWYCRKMEMGSAEIAWSLYWANSLETKALREALAGLPAAKPGPTDGERLCGSCNETNSRWQYNRCPNCGEMEEPADAKE